MDAKAPMRAGNAGGKKRKEAVLQADPEVPAETEDEEPNDFFEAEEMERFTALAGAGKMRLDEDAGESDFDALEASDDSESGGGGDSAKTAKFADFFAAKGAGGGSGDAGRKKAVPKGQGKDAVAQANARGGEVEGSDVDEAAEEDEEEGLEGDEGDDLSDQEKELEEKIRDLQQASAKDGRAGEGDGSEEGGKGSAGEDDAGMEGEGSEEELGPQERGGSAAKSLYDMDRRLHALEEEVAKLEEEQLKSKPWELRGEVSAKQRPLNSLLEVHLDQPMTHFAGRRAEEAAIAAGMNPDGDEAALDDVPGAEGLMKQSAFDVEAIIRQRIWDEAFDDLARKAALPPSQRPQGAEDDPVETLNFEKSRVGLGDIYAKQYEAEMLGHATEAQVQEDQFKTETKELFAKLMHKLDQLTNAHFTPRPPMLGAGGEQLAKAPSLKMEETIPLLVSDAQLKAPEELRAPRRHERGREELNHEERAAARRLKKTMRKKKLEQKVEAGQMSREGLKERTKKLGEKNLEAKRELKNKGVVKDQKVRLRSSQLLAQAAENAKSQTSRKEEARRERQKQAASGTSKRFKL